MKRKHSGVHAEALRELEKLAGESSVIEVRGSAERELADIGKCLDIVVCLDLAELDRSDDGFEIADSEEIVLSILPGYPRSPPVARVTHRRWRGKPHVLDDRLCVFLDPFREWTPESGMRGFMNRLWSWFEDAAAGRFDAATSLWHAFGGFTHEHPGNETLVIGDIGDVAPGVRPLALKRRTDHCLEVEGWGRLARDGELPGLAIVFPGSLPSGAGHDIPSFLRNIRECGHAFPPIPTIQQALQRLGDGDPTEVVYMVVGARTTAIKGPGTYQMICAAVERRAVQAGVQCPAETADGVQPFTWLRVEDLRSGVSTRRDAFTPMCWFHGKTVTIWGLGALGSWVAEAVVRAGVSRLLLSDPGTVNTGLLIRQNYTRSDIGMSKADALARRIEAIRADVEVRPLVALGGRPDELTADLIVDTSVSTLAASYLDELTASGALNCPVVQLATDAATATIGLALIWMPECGRTLGELEQVVRSAAGDDPAMEPYEALWRDDRTNLFLPTPGCSIPTFHGSFADAAGVAAVGANLAAKSLGACSSGGWLFSLPHSPTTAPPRLWIPAGTVADHRGTAALAS